MAKLQVSPEFLRAALFGAALNKWQVAVRGARILDNGIFEFDISGDGVPDAEKIVAVFSRTSNKTNVKFIAA